MQLQRSQTAPQGLSAFDNQRRNEVRPLARSTSSSALELPIPAYTLRRDTDPFHLSGFYPSECSWIKGGVPVHEPHVEAQYYDAEGLIAKEDKFGILKLEKLNLFEENSEPEDSGFGVLMSPYSNNDVVDEESLYLKLRAQKGISINIKVEQSESLSIFFADTSELGIYWNWMDRIFG